MSRVLYLDTSVVLRAVLERGMSPEVEARISAARFLITSRLALVEVARALLRIRSTGALTETAIADAGREIDSILARCTLWELTPAVCELAGQVSPQRALRSLDALHLASYLLARRRLGSDLELLTVDQRMQEAASAI